VLNEKRMVSDAGLDPVRPVFASIGRTAAELAEAADVVRAVITGQGEAQRSPPRRCITVARTTARE
jgi:hypothetical protein